MALCAVPGLSARTGPGSSPSPGSSWTGALCPELWLRVPVSSRVDPDPRDLGTRLCVETGPWGGDGVRPGPQAGPPSKWLLSQLRSGDRRMQEAARGTPGGDPIHRPRGAAPLTPAPCPGCALRPESRQTRRGSGSPAALSWASRGLRRRSRRLSRAPSQQGTWRPWEPTLASLWDGWSLALLHRGSDFLRAVLGPPRGSWGSSGSPSTMLAPGPQSALLATPPSSGPESPPAEGAERAPAGRPGAEEGWADVVLAPQALLLPWGGRGSFSGDQGLCNRGARAAPPAVGQPLLSREPM